MEDAYSQGEESGLVDLPEGERSLYPIDMLEEYSASHPETIEELIDWESDRFDAAWSSYKLRTELDRLELDQRALVAAMYASGSGGDDLTKALEQLSESFQSKRAEVIIIYRGEDGELEQDTSEEFITEKWW